MQLRLTQSRIKLLLICLTVGSVLFYIYMGATIIYVDSETDGGHGRTHSVPVDYTQRDRSKAVSTHPAGYLGCFIPTDTERTYQRATSRKMTTPGDCIYYCQSTDHMYAYYKIKKQLCSCDNQFYTRGLGTLPCGSSETQSADVYHTANITTTKYKLLIGRHSNLHCGCTSNQCSQLSCLHSDSLCYVGPIPKLLRNVSSRPCSNATVKHFYGTDKDHQYCADSLHGFLPARCEEREESESHPLESIKTRLYKVLRGSRTSKVMSPLTPRTNQKKVLLLTHMRSGSTFLSEFFKGYPNSYYMYEPLYGLTSDVVGCEHEEVSRHQVASRSVELLNRAYRCQFDQIPLSSITYTVLKMNDFFKACNHSRPDSRLSCVQAHYSSCLSSDMIAIKTIRAKLDWARQLLETGPKDLKIVYLIRDPRGLLVSRMKMKTNSIKYYSQSSKGYCDALIEDLLVYKKLMNSTYKDQVLLLRYEDIVRDNIAAARYIYKYLNLGQVPEQLITHIKKLREPSETNEWRMYSTRRENSFETAFKWKQNMYYYNVKVIDAHCKKAYRMSGYLPINSEDDLRNPNLTHKVN